MNARASIVDDILQLEGIHFVGEVKMHCDFEHDFDEIGNHIDELQRIQKFSQLIS